VPHALGCVAAGRRSVHGMSVADTYAHPVPEITNHLTKSIPSTGETNRYMSPQMACLVEQPLPDSEFVLRAQPGGRFTGPGVPQDKAIRLLPGLDFTGEQGSGVPSVCPRRDSEVTIW
jgi:hypothetical protein